VRTDKKLENYLKDEGLPSLAKLLERARKRGCMIHAYNRQRLAEKAGEARKMAPGKVDSIDDR